VKKMFKGCLVVVGLVVVLGIVGAVLGGRSGGTATQPNSAAVAPAATTQQSDAATSPPTEAAPQSYTIGQDVTVDEMRWKIVSAEDLGNTLESDNQFVTERTSSGRWVRVRFEMENLSKDMLSFAGLDLVDAQGRTLKPSSDAIQFIAPEESCILENLNPNVAKTCTVIYEVPANATGLQAQVTDLKILGGSETLIDLGL
jgi:hypothetical protein